MSYYQRNSNKKDKFLCSDTNKDRLAQKIELYIGKGYEQVGRTGEDLDPFNGRVRYVAVLRKKVVPA